MIAARHAQFVWVGVLWAYRAQVWSVSKGVKRGGGAAGKAQYRAAARRGSARHVRLERLAALCAWRKGFHVPCIGTRQPLATRRLVASARLRSFSGWRQSNRGARAARG